MAKLPSGSPAHELDARLLRFRSHAHPAAASAEELAKLAADLLAADRAHEALEVTGAALQARPGDYSLLILEARARYVTGDLLRAQAVLLKAARLAPAQKEPFRLLGEVLLKRGDPQRAVKVLERARAIAPDDRAIEVLHARAARLAQIAETDPAATAEASRAAFERKPVAAEDDGDAPTVVRPDPSERVFRAPEARAAETRAGAARHGATVLEEEELTSVMGPDMLAAMARAARSDPAPEPVATPGRGAPEPPLAAPQRRTLPRGAAGAHPGTSAVPPAKALHTTPAPPPLGPAPSTAFHTTPAPPPLGPAPSTAPHAPPRRAHAAPRPRRSAPEPTPPAAADSFDDDRSPRVAPLQPAVESPAKEAALPAPDDPFGAPAHGEPVRAYGAGGDDTSDAPAEGTPDLPGGERAGRPEEVTEILELLRRQGIFEPPAGEPATWAPRKEAHAERTKIGVWVAGAWVVAGALAAGVWFGWEEFVRQRHARSSELVEQARAEARAGDHERLVDAERHLREARELDPRNPQNPTVLLFVHAQRALEDGAFEVGYLRPTIARAERMHADERWLHAARAVLAAGEGDLDQARAAVERALDGGDASDPGILYVAGRIAQRLGDERALEHLQAAVERDPQLTAAAIALAEARYDEGRPEDAIALLDGVLERDPRNLRASLWKAFLTADEQDPEAALAALQPLETRLERGAPTDRVLVELTRARLLRRQGHAEPAAAAVEAAMRAGAQEPRLLALMARAARAAGRLLQAEYAATAALRSSPSNPDFRKLLAGIHLDRRNGPAALTTLAQLPADDPAVLQMMGHAALLVGTEAALGAAADAIDRYLQANEDASLELRALRIRIGVQIAPAAPLLAQARALARENPGEPTVLLALGEAALAARSPNLAVPALEQAVRASPDDAEGHYLLGRARRMIGDAEGAQASFRRAIALRPEHAEALIGLGSLLLDLGDWEAADAHYVEIARMGGSVGGMSLAMAGRIGRVEALTGLRRFEDAEMQLEGVRDEARQSPSARIAAAHLAIARGRAGDAIRELRPLVAAADEGAAPSPSVLALYGDALLLAGEVDGAAEAYERALRADAGLPEALIGRAELLVRAEHERDAAPLLAQARVALESRIRPPALRARLLMLEGRVALRARDRERARAKLREATAIEGVPPEAFFFLGEALASENSPEARAAYRRYLELAPEGTFAMRARRATAPR